MSWRVAILPQMISTPLWFLQEILSDKFLRAVSNFLSTLVQTTSAMWVFLKLGISLLILEKCHILSHKWVRVVRNIQGSLKSFKCYLRLWELKPVLTQGSAHATLLSTRMTLGAPHFIWIYFGALSAFGMNFWPLTNTLTSRNIHCKCLQGITGTLQGNRSAGISNLWGLHVYLQSL